jgi:hypothetical protein
MDFSLNQIASIVMNDVFAGLKAKTNVPLTIEQVKDEAVALRGRLMKERFDSGIKNFEGFYQEINCLSLVCTDISKCCNIDSGVKYLGAVVPKLFDLLVPSKQAVRYVGRADRFQNFNILTGNDYIDLPYQRWTSRVPSAWFDYSGMVWIFNPPTDEMDILSIIAIFDDPRSVAAYSCTCASDDDPFPIPSWMVDTITGKLIHDYLRYFRQGDAQPNTMSPLENGPQPRIV